MTITFKLSDTEIRNAIRKLQSVQEHIRWGISDTVDMLAKEGADIAKEAYGNFGGVNVTSYLRKDNEAVIATSGDANVIAEFGAGYATLENHPFADKADTPIEIGSYSKENDGMFYWSDYANPGEGYWFFGGREYSEVKPRMGLLLASEMIKEIAVDKAKDVIKL